MPIFYPDILEHNNPAKALVDITQLRGSSYPVGTLTETGSIPSDKRKLGAIIFVSSSQQFYGFYGQTTASIDWDSPSNWRTLSTFSGSYTGSFSGSFIGDGSGLINIPASGITGLNLSQIATGSISASVSTGTGSFTVTSGSDNLLFVSSSGQVLVGVTSSTYQFHVERTTGPVAFFGRNSISNYFTINRAGGGAMFEVVSDNTLNPVMTIAGTGTADTLRILDNTTPVFVVKDGGNTGIGTSAPTARLQVKGTGTTSSTTTLRVENVNASASMVVLDNGNVGIGTVAPGQKLTIQTTSSNDGLFLETSQNLQYINLTNNNSESTPVGKISLYYGATNAGIISVDSNRLTLRGGYTTGGSILFSSVTTEIARITNVGLGIGTSTPTASLHISGSSGSVLLEIDSNSNQNILFVSGSGNVGLGTNNPQYKLDVYGNYHQYQSQGLIARYDISTANANQNRGVWDFYTNAAVSPDFFGRFGFKFEGGTADSFKQFQVHVADSTTPKFIVDGSGRVGIGTITPTSQLQIKGSGTTSSTTTLRVENANASASLVILDNGNTSINGNTQLTGSLNITASAGTGSAFTVYKSGSTVMSIQGSQGELFSITDSLSGSLFSVSNISGLPILEVFSDNTTLIGNYLDPMLITTQKVTANSGSTVIYSLPTSSYDAAYYEYTIKSGSNARTGQIMSVWAGTSVQFTDNSTLDVGDTTGFIFGVILSGSNMVLTGSASTNAWTVKTIIRSI